MKISAVSVWRRSRVIRLRTCAWTEMSSAETASSSTSVAGSAASARAIATRCRWPPERWRGRRFASSTSRPTPSSSCATRRSRVARSRSNWMRSTSAIAEPTVWRGSSEVYGFWKTSWIWRARCRRRSRRLTPSDLSRANVTTPAVGRSSPTSIFATVVLPEPDSPTIPTAPARWRVNDMSATAMRSWPLRRAR